jgi:hypothetical protein
VQFRGGRARRTVLPQPVLGLGVDTVDEVGQAFDEIVIRRLQQLDLHVLRVA